MSAIACKWNRDGSPIDPTQFQSSLDRLNHRGPDGTYAWVSGEVGLGMQLFRTLPPAVLGSQPASHPENGSVIVADARLDNRSELCERLQPELSGRSLVSDPELILASYARWSDECPAHLVGDFAFVIWDPRARCIFCARDRLGVRQLHYVCNAGLFAAATEISALMPFAPRRSLDVDAGLQFLTWNFWGPERTLFDGVSRLLPAQTLRVTSTGFRTARYWELDCERESQFGSEGEAAEAFRELLERSVADRMLTAGAPIGTFLSGGLDSSSITCLARNRLLQGGEGPLLTFSAVSGEPTDEQPQREAVVATGGIQPSYIEPPEPWGPLAAMDEMMVPDDEPIWLRGLGLARKLRLAARSAGAQVLLDGEGGDEALSYGLGHLTDLVRKGRLFRATIDSRKAARLDPASWRWIAWHYGVRPFVPLPIRDLRRRARIATGSPVVVASYLTGSALSRIADSPRTAAPACRNRSRREHVDMLMGSSDGLVFGLLDRLSASVGVEPRYPFTDVGLVEFCVALPGHLKLKNGWQRYMLRRAMDGVLPDMVRWRTDKADGSRFFVDGLATHGRAQLAAVAKRSSLVEAGLVDPVALRNAVPAFFATPDMTRGFMLWKIAVLDEWLARPG